MKPLSHEDRRELEDLLDDLAADCLAPEDRLRLNTLLLNNPAAQQMHLDYFSMHAALHRSSASQPTDDDRHAALVSAELEPQTEVAPGIQPTILSGPSSPAQPVLGFLGKATHWVRRPVIWSVLGAGVLYAGYVVTISWDMLSKTLPSGANGDGTTVAGITGSLDAIWTTQTEAGPSALHPNNRGAVCQGETLQIATGLVELQLQQGTRLVVKGPARWTIDDQNSATLSYGTVVAKVPRAAIGFTLSTPSARVVDLGTEFGVVVTEDGASAVHVLSGTIDWQRQEPSGKVQSRILRTGQNESVAASGHTMQANPKLGADLARLAEVQFTAVPGFSAGSSSITRMIDLSRVDTSQSSMYEPGSYPAKNAIDGDFKSFAHTGHSDRAPWWQIDLGRPRTIAAVVLHNRQDYAKSRFRDITITLLAEDGVTVVAKSPLLNVRNEGWGGWKEPATGPAELTFDLTRTTGQPSVGRFLRVERTGDVDDDNTEAGVQTYLTLAEVQLFEPAGTRPAVLPRITPK